MAATVLAALKKQRTPNVCAKNFESRLSETSPAIAIVGSTALRRIKYAQGIYYA
jgi:hypothetical protein